MPMPPLGRLPTHFVLFASLVIAAGGPGSVVLCMGLDGHVAVEVALGEDCGTEEGHHATHGSAPEPSFGVGCGDHCGPCIDVAMSHVAQRADDFWVPGPAARASACPEPRGASGGPGARRAPGARSASRGPAGFASTTVLRI
jgi:hypothetical protein